MPFSAFLTGFMQNVSNHKIPHFKSIIIIITLLQPQPTHESVLQPCVLLRRPAHAPLPRHPTQVQRGEEVQPDELAGGGAGEGGGGVVDPHGTVLPE